VDVPASIPEVTGVGGTEFTGDPDSIITTTYWLANNSPTGESAISYIPEIAWNDTLANNQLSAGAGGASKFFTKPAWQIGTGVPADGQRDVPDLSFSASSDHDPYLICSGASNFPCVNGYLDSNNRVNTVGGTSVAAPVFAGIIAIINQAKNSAQGNVNPTLYSLAMSSPQVFHDITTGSNAVPCTAGKPDCPSSGTMTIGFVADTGYDQASGLGSVDANALVKAWPTDFSIAVDPNRVSISAPGATGSAAILLNPIDNFAGTVTLTCSPQAGVAGLSCSIAPSTVNQAGPNATLNISTLGAGAALRMPLFGSGPSQISSTPLPATFHFELTSLRSPAGALGFLILASMGVALACTTLRPRTRVAFLLAGALPVLAVMLACGKGSGIGGGGTCSAVPAAPTGVTASSTTNLGTTLTWTAPAAPSNCTITGYAVYQNGVTTPVGTSTTPTLAVTGLNPTTQYSFTVVASDADGVSPASAPVSVTTTASGGTPPGNYTLTITATSGAVSYSTIVTVGVQ
jgi:hypothetical protein